MLLPLVYIRIIGESGVTAATVALLAAGAFASGAMQLRYAKLTRMISRRKILGAGAFGEAVGVPIVFWLMAVSFILAGLSVLPIRAGGRRPGTDSHVGDAEA